MTVSPEARIAHLEAAFLELLDRIVLLEASNRELEQRLDFEVAQRIAYEAMIGRMTGLPGRLDHAEREIISLRKRAIGLRL